MQTLPFRYFLRVRYGECDAQKVVFNARWGDYIDLAVSEFLRTLGFGDALGSGELDYQLVKQTVEWKSPARFDDVLEVRVQTHRVGTTSFTIGCEFRRADREALLASAETVYVRVEANSLEKIPVSPMLRAALERGAPNRISDHAGRLAGDTTLIPTP
jgi:acyl-CoA thioester hydrolase